MNIQDIEDAIAYYAHNSDDEDKITEELMSISRLLLKIISIHKLPLPSGVWSQKTSFVFNWVRCASVQISLYITLEETKSYILISRKEKIISRSKIIIDATNPDQIDRDFKKVIEDFYNVEA